MTHRLSIIRVLPAMVLVGTAMSAGGCEPEGQIELRGVITDLHAVVPEVVLRNASRTVSEHYTFADGAPTVLYLNMDGVTIKHANTSDARANASFIGGGTVPAFSGSQSTRDQVVELVKQLYAAYNIAIVTQRPASGDYDMLVIGGTPAHIGLNAPSGVAGVAPMDCYDQMPRDISFVFSDNIQYMVPSSRYAQAVAEVAAHEAAHAYGLPHSAVGCDLMSYGQCGALKTFLDQKMNMQSDSYGQCGMTSMNSHQLLIDDLGPAQGAPPPPTLPGDTTPPQVKIDSPTNGAQTSSSVTVRATASDASGVTRVDLHVDGKAAGSRSSTPYEFNVTLAPGQHTLAVHAYDAAGNEGSASVTVSVVDSQAPTTSTAPATEPGSTTPADPAAGPSDQLGQFGAACDGPGDCGSGLCAHDPAADDKYCTDQCDPERGDQACPDGALCMKTNTAIHVCSAPLLASAGTDSPAVDDAPGFAPRQETWPALYGGCNLAPGEGGAPSLVLGLLALLGLAIVRRRP